jgi:hypothetical protein
MDAHRHTGRGWVTRGRYFGFCGVSVSSAWLPLSIAAAARATVATATFVAPGEHSFTVPAGVDEVTVVAIGARGGTDRQSRSNRGTASAPVAAAAKALPAERSKAAVRVASAAARSQILGVMSGGLPGALGGA